ncbi:hypothetical protein EG68_01937 [Paragonimus skrjabini miyazakii]|uniref:Alpha-MPP n=1 Tax=Paragonimus skrjabini miyazakii TaxID=59628 RepID=A0A8S9Z1B7_9TREM|nr:hypothetical protein EG68_01937 [Paragonimus skrjabini miyazakii]
MHSIGPRLGVSRCLRTQISRLLSQNVSKSNDGISVPLSEPLIGKISTFPNDDFVEDNETKITTLKNGLRIASQNKFGAQCAMGVIVDAGPRYEVDRPSGISHYLEKLGFHSSDSYSDRNHVQSAMEECNAIFDCQISRDFIIYAVSGFNTNMERLVQILSETVLRPRITAEEVQMAERSIRFELQALQRAPPVEPIMNELLHGAAYRGNSTLGLPRYCPESNLGQITRDHIINFVATYYRPERLVVAGVGVQHDAFVKAVESAFTPCEHSLAKEPAAKNAPAPDASVAQYTGGYVKVERDLSQYHAPMPEFAHAAIGLESCGYRDAQFVPACLLHSLLGGGGSFSAGGPGKGMYTRLYVNVLNEHHWVNSAQAENHSYADTGLFAITGSSDPRHLDRLVLTLVTELRHTVESSISAEELSRAKAQLKSMLLMNLETRAVTFEDIARQVLTTGRRYQPEYWANKIDQVTVNDLHDLLHRMITQSPPTLVGFGRVDRLPSREEVQLALSKPLASRFSNRLPNLFKRFV